MGLEWINKPGMDTQKTQFRSSKRKQFYRCRHCYNPKYIDPAFGCSLKNKRQGYCCVPPKIRPWIDFGRMLLTWQKQTGFSHFEQPSMQSVWHGQACYIIYHRYEYKKSKLTVSASNICSATFHETRRWGTCVHALNVFIFALFSTDETQVIVPWKRFFWLYLNYFVVLTGSLDQPERMVMFLRSQKSYKELC